MSKKILNTYTDDESAFITRVTGQPLSAASVRAALRQWAIWTLQDAGDLFLPREKGANFRNLTTEQKSAAAKKRWANRKPRSE